jgi:hypothetical protein
MSSNKHIQYFLITFFKRVVALNSLHGPVADRLINTYAGGL